MKSLSSNTALPILVAATFFMENLDATIITPAIPAMAHSFGVMPVDLNTGVSAYMLTLGMFIPISGWAAEYFGIRKVFALAIAIFTFASILCGFSQNLPQFICSRILQGIGGAMMVPVGRLAVLRETPKNRLIETIAILTWPGLVAPVLGPPLGGLISDWGEWRAIFYINIPLGIIAFLTALKIVPKSIPDKSKSFDWWGFISISSALFFILAAAEMLPRPDANITLIISSLALGILLMFAGIWHLNHSKQPMFNLNALKVPSFAVTIWGGSLFRMGVSAVPFLIPLMYQIAFGFNAFHAGLMLMAVFAGNITMKPFTTNIMKKFGFKNTLIINGLVNAVMIMAIATFNISMPLWVMCIILFIGGMARSMQFTALNSIAFADIPKEEMPSANTLFSTAFQLAMGLGVAVGAIGWRMGEKIASGGSTIMPFHIAFIFIGILSFIAIIDCVLLKNDAGANVTQKS